MAYNKIPPHFSSQFHKEILPKLFPSFVNGKGKNLHLVILLFNYQQVLKIFRKSNSLMSKIHNYLQMKFTEIIDYILVLIQNCFFICKQQLMYYIKSISNTLEASHHTLIETFTKHFPIRIILKKFCNSVIMPN